MDNRYYMQEVENLQSVKNSFDLALEAASLSSAKRVTSKHQFFQNTVLKLYADFGCNNLLAYKKNNKWINL